MHAIIQFFAIWVKGYKKKFYVTNFCSVIFMSNYQYSVVAWVPLLVTVTDAYLPGLMGRELTR